MYREKAGGNRMRRGDRDEDLEEILKQRSLVKPYVSAIENGETGRRETIKKRHPLTELKDKDRIEKLKQYILEFEHALLNPDDPDDEESTDEVKKDIDNAFLNLPICDEITGILEKVEISYRKGQINAKEARIVLHRIIEIYTPKNIK